jgi:membrane protein implicated in regulation of membrane protease activity
MEFFDSLSIVEVWMAIGITLIAIEMLVLSGALIFVGMSFIALSMLTGVFEFSLITQIILLSVFLFTSFFLGKYVFKKIYPGKKPLANYRDSELLGRCYHLHTAIVDGAGEVKIGDALYSVYGANAAIGTAVKVTAKKGMGFEVEVAVDQ